MKSWIIPIILMMLYLLLGGACQSAEQITEEEWFATQQTPDRPFRPLQAALSAPQDSKSSDSDERVDSETPSIESMLTGDLDAAISSTTEALLSAINLRRALDGWPPLISQAALTEIANYRAVDMSVHAYLSHEDPGTAEILVENMLIEMGYHGKVAELVYAANEPLDRLGVIAIEEWFDDPVTRSVLLSPGFRFIGIGMVGDGTTWKIVQALAEHGP